MHNWEIARVIKAISLQKSLTQIDEYKRKGTRRRYAVLFAEAFPLALALAHIDGNIDPAYLEFWDEQLSLAPEQSQERPVRQHQPRRQNAPRRQRRKQH
jgi:hypothetical protein